MMRGLCIYIIFCACLAFDVPLLLHRNRRQQFRSVFDKQQQPQHVRDCLYPCTLLHLFHM